MMVVADDPSNFPGAVFVLPEMNELPFTDALSDEEGFGVFLGDGQEFEGGLAGAAGALFPASYGVGAYVEVGGEEGLAGVQSLADAADFIGGDGLGARRDARDAQVDGLAALVA